MSNHDEYTAHRSSKLESDERKHGKHEWKAKMFIQEFPLNINEQKSHNN